MPIRDLDPLARLQGGPIIALGLPDLPLHPHTAEGAWSTRSEPVHDNRFVPYGLITLVKLGVRLFVEAIVGHCEEDGPTAWSRQSVNFPQ